MVNFVGAGPGAADLITVRGQRLLSEADVIIYAGSLVNPELLKYAKKDCIIHNSAYMTLEEVIEVMKDAESKGMMTVRLHTGDPSIYGAIREQLDELEALKIEYSICPGVSSFFGAAASLGIEYTLPAISQSVIITRAEGRTAVPERESLKSLAAHHSTLVLFLSSSLADKVKEELLAGGLSANTPAAVVYKATWQDEKKIITTLGELPHAMKKENITKTALIIVGEVLGDTYEKSKLYDRNFSTEYRKALE
jgi:precorrin-4/cobalt-precorrin-4 C11-methyltransferase